MLMLVTDGTGGDQFTSEIGFHSNLCFSLNTDNNLYATLVEDVYCSATHTAGDNDLCAVICQKVRQEAGAMAGIRNRIDCDNLAVSGVKENEIFTIIIVSFY